MQIRQSSIPWIQLDFLCYFGVISETRGGGINSVVICGGSFCICTGLIMHRVNMAAPGENPPLHTSLNKPLNLGVCIAYVIFNQHHFVLRNKGFNIR